MGLNNRLLNEINRVCKPNTILIINGTGTLIRLYTPFQVKPVHSFHVFERGKIYLVSFVRLDQELMMHYVIDRVAYPYFYFIIIL
jgi:hypothetical protein